MGYDRPSPDHANADLILLISAHLESGHYFNPHAQRVMDGKARGAKLVVLDVRLSNTATHADHWLAPWPGSEPAILLAIANWLIQEERYDREFVRRYWNWQEYLEAEQPGEPASFEAFEKARREDKPIFLSIGYSTCHWCHVMEHESFSDAGLAARWSERGILAVEMEAAVLFTLGALRKIQAGCMLIVSDVVVEGEFIRITDEEMRAAVDQMTELALGTVTA